MPAGLICIRHSGASANLQFIQVSLCCFRCIRTRGPLVLEVGFGLCDAPRHLRVPEPKLVLESIAAAPFACRFGTHTSRKRT